MQTCKLCNKALEDNTPDSLCEHCRTMKGNLSLEQLTHEKLVKDDRQGTRFLLGFLLLFLLVYVGAVGYGDWKSIHLAEQTVVDTVQAELGYTPFRSSQVVHRYQLGTIVAVRYSLVEEELKQDTCPMYFVEVSGRSAKILLVHNSPPTAEES